MLNQDQPDEIKNYQVGRRSSHIVITIA
jgi:hypothetical protein